MSIFSLKEIDEIRKRGMRPGVVGCFVHNKKILFMHRTEFDLWALPQGGINNQESMEDAIVREMQEEIGKGFVENSEVVSFFGRDAVFFPEQSQNQRELKDDDGKVVFMKGKEYFFILLSSATEEVIIENTEFDDYIWADYEKAKSIAESIYQSGKKRITMQAIESLHAMNKI